MYAVVIAGGKQFKVNAGDVIEVEKLDKQVGEKVELDVLLRVEGSDVSTGKDISTKAEAEVLSQHRAKKIVVYKYKPKKNQRKKQGHRQPYTRIKITNIG